MWLLILSHKIHRLRFWLLGHARVEHKGEVVITIDIILWCRNLVLKFGVFPRSGPWSAWVEVRQPLSLLLNQLLIIIGIRNLSLLLIRLLNLFNRIQIRPMRILTSHFFVVLGEAILNRCRLSKAGLDLVNLLLTLFLKVHARVNLDVFWGWCFPRRLIMHLLWLREVIWTFRITHFLLGLLFELLVARLGEALNSFRIVHLFDILCLLRLYQLISEL